MVFCQVPLATGFTLLDSTKNWFLLARVSSSRETLFHKVLL